MVVRGRESVEELGSLEPLRESRVSVIIPTLDAGPLAEGLVAALCEQTPPPSELIILDSESADGTPDVFERAGAQVVSVSRKAFHHASVRNQGAMLAKGNILVFLTQDARPEHPEFLARLAAPLAAGEAAAAFARQRPRDEATPLERYARETNYPIQGRVVTQDDVARLGVRAFFFSNSASAVRRDVWERLGGFPGHTIMNEDMLFAEKLLRAGGRVAYAADAVAEHSHDYTVSQTFRRYFDIGVVFAQAPELDQTSLGGEGFRYVGDLLRFLTARRLYTWVPKALLESAAKWVGLSLGKKHRQLPRALVRRASMHRAYWR